MQRRPGSPLIRYWLARLRPLTRPVIWAPVSLLGLVILFAWDISTKPDWWTALVPSPPAGGELSQEEQAIAADIDTSLLLNNFGLSVPGTTADGDQPANAPSPNAGNPNILPGIPLLGLLPKDQDAAAPSNLAGLINSSTDNPSGRWGAGNRMSLGSSAADSTSGNMAQLPGFSLLQPPAPTAVSALAIALGQTQNNPNPTNQSALVTALARYGSAPISGTEANRLTVNPLSPLNPTVLSPLQGTTGLSGGLNGGLNGSLSGSQSTVVPLEGSTGLNTTAPITPVNNAFSNLTGNQALPNGLGLAPVGVVPNPAPMGAISPVETTNPAANPLNSGSNPAAVPVNPQPFSVPRSVPGRSIGGGNINTFSNP